MERKLCFITDGSPALDWLEKEFASGLQGICETREMRLEDACRAELPEALVMPYLDAYATNRDYQELAARITERFGQDGAEDLRVYIFPVDMEKDAFEKRMFDGSDHALEELGDVIQIVPGWSTDQLVLEIKEYFETRESIRMKRIRSGRKHRIQWVVGLAATVLTVLSILYTFLRSWAAYLPETASGGFLASLFGRIDLDPVIMRLTWFTGWIMILSVLINFFQKGFTGADNEVERIICYLKDAVLLCVIIGSAVMATHLLALFPDPRWYLIPAGIAVALVLDVLRRQRSVGQRYLRFKALDKAMSTGKDHMELAAKLRNSGRRPITNALRKPYLHKGRVKIFVSYTHSSQWSQERVRELIGICGDTDIECFVDKHGIPRGASWRRSIFSSLLDADYLIAFADEKSVVKQWPAAEIEMALSLRSISGAPQAVVFVPPEFPYRVTEQYMPVYRDTMLCSSEPDFFVRVIWYSPLALRTLVAHAIAKQETKAPNALFPGKYKGWEEDKKKKREANRSFAEIYRARRMWTNQALGGNPLQHPDVDDRFGIKANPDPDDEAMLQEFVNNAQYAIRNLMPQQAYLFLREAVEVASGIGNAEVMANLCLKLCSVLYGSLLSDYRSYLEIHRYEYFAAFAFMKAGDRRNAVRWATMCLQGLESIEALREYFFKGFNIGRSTRWNPLHGTTVLPMEFKLLSSSGFKDIRPKAKAILK